MTDDRIILAYRHCQQLAKQHYENFPVASRILPSSLRAPVSAIYAFARTADDFADEGNYGTEFRLDRLKECDNHLEAIVSGETINDPVYIALADAIQRYHLPVSLMHDLVSAFRQDVTKKRYKNFDEVMDYCRRSANPVGRLLLHLLDKATEDNCQLSDNICSALQLINFYQDIVQDYEEQSRIYLPSDEMSAAGVSEEHINRRILDENIARLMSFQYKRAKDMLCSGIPLCSRLGPRMNLEIRATINGGLRVLELLETRNDIYSRPRLGKYDLLIILIRSVFKVNTCQAS